MLAAFFFTLAIIHSFLIKKFKQVATKFEPGSIPENLFRLLGELEIAFGLWACLFILSFMVTDGYQATVDYLNTQSFREPCFVFAVLVLCSTRPILESAERLILKIAGPSKPLFFYALLLVIGPLLGSIITEPAAMTVTALLLLKYFFNEHYSEKFKYATLATLFVNISVGGVLTPYAAPPVLMVATPWGLTLTSMMQLFGLKSMMTCLLTTGLCIWRFRHEFRNAQAHRKIKPMTPIWIRLIHMIFLALTIFMAHDLVLFIGVFLLFMAFVEVTDEYQDKLKLREGLLIALFLGSLVILGNQQQGWLEPLLASLSTTGLFFGALGLSAITDNAAITYLGSLVPTLSESGRYALLSGAICGGGLTIIANAPNPAGFSLLGPGFGEEGAEPIQLFKNALLPTLIAAICFYL